MLTQSQKDLILEVAIAQGFIGKKGDKYLSTTFAPTVDLKKALRGLNFPGALRVHGAELLDVMLDLENYQRSIGQIFTDYASSQVYKPSIPEDLAADGSGLVNKIRSLIPTIDITGRSKEKLILINPETRRPVYDLDIDIYLSMTGQKEAELLAKGADLCVVPFFNPYSLETFSQRVHKYLDIEVRHLNTYVPPKWRFAQAEPKYGGFIKTLMEHLFPIAEEREDVLNWLHYAITKRNGTILCLAGPRGTGKSLLMSILSYLVGEDFSEMVNKEILEEKFNSAFKNKRLIIFEEVEVSNSTAINKLKALANNRIVLEEKGKDSETIDNYTSMAILLNDISQLRIEAQDRRFSVPKVADHDLRTVLSEREITEFSDSLLGEEVFEEVAEFGEFLLARKPNRSYMYAIKGDYYYFLCTMAISEWKNFIIEFIADRGEEGTVIPIKKISAAFKTKYATEEGGKGLKFPDRGQTFELFLKDYKHRGDHYIGTFMKEMDESSGREVNAILPNPEFLDYIESTKLKTAKVQPKKKETGKESSAMMAIEKRRREEAEAMGAL